MGRHLLKRLRVGGAAVGITALVALALPAIASASLDGGDGKWVPGSILVKFGPSNVNSVRAFVSRATAGEVIRPLPIIPDAYEIRVDGSVEGKIGALFTNSREEAADKPKVQWAQPNYYAHLKFFTSPTDKRYWPNDPLYWPSEFSNPNSCPQQPTELGQEALWPWYGDLANQSGVWNPSNPLPSAQRPPDTGLFNVGLSGAASSSIDVLPAWNALRDTLTTAQPTTGRTAVGAWSAADLERSGIGVWDTGVSNAPDLQFQVAGLFSVGTQPGDVPTERWEMVYADSKDRAAAERSDLRNALVGVESDPGYRPTLMGIDDFGSGPLGAREQVPNGCDGHGSEVASVAAADAGNGKGVAGVAWNVPVVGLRLGAPVLDTKKTLSLHTSTQENILSAVRQAKPWGLSDGSMIDALAIVRTLKLPVLNMSWGSQLFMTEEVGGQKEVVVNSPGVVEALGRVLTDRVTLGVAAAGPGQYGFGRNNTGAVTAPGANNAANLPCALRKLDKYKVKVIGAIGSEPFDPGVHWSTANLICVTGTFADSPELLPDAGGGDAAVDLAAPGVDTAATRPTGEPFPSETYRLVFGTSYAAAMVSGAAALLREVAPKAPPAIIARALRVGARPDVQLARSVGSGTLDVACSALWLAKRPESELAEWGVRVPAAKLEVAETKHCFQPSNVVYQYTWDLSKSWFDDGSTTVEDEGLSRVGIPRRQSSLNLAQTAFPNFPQDNQTARGIQNVVLGPDSTWNTGNTAFFPIKSGPRLLQRPQLLPQRVVYNFQGETVACPAGSRPASFGLKWLNSIHPQGFIWFSPRASLSATTFMVALIKPWFVDFLPSTMRIAVTVQCVRPPAL